MSNTLSIIVIGLNEEKNLGKCLSSISKTSIPEYTIEIIYVDSGSTDQSVDIAKSFPTVRVVHLEDAAPSAAKARNKGIKMANGNFIQFIDGDSVLDRIWLSKALPVINNDTSIAAVFGDIDEVAEHSSLYMKVCKFDWYMPPGDYRLCGGNALWRHSVFDEIGIFDGELIAGEEPDLCCRVRQKGYRIVCIDEPMVKHDLDMHSFKDYWRRIVRSGTAYAIIGMRYRKTKEKLWHKEMMRNFLEVVLLLMLMILGILHSWLLAGTLFLSVTFYRIIKIMINVMPRTKNLFDALLYAIHIQFSRIPLVYGQIIGFYKLWFITDK